MFCITSSSTKKKYDKIKELGIWMLYRHKRSIAVCMNYLETKPSGGNDNKNLGLRPR